MRNLKNSLCFKDCFGAFGVKNRFYKLFITFEQILRILEMYDLKILRNSEPQKMCLFVETV